MMLSLRCKAAAMWLVLATVWAAGAAAATPEGPGNKASTRLPTDVPLPPLTPQSRWVVANLPRQSCADGVAQAERLMLQNDLLAAQARLEQTPPCPAAELMRARIALSAGNYSAALALLDGATGPVLAPLVAQARGRIALAQGRPAQAAAWLTPLLHGGGAQAQLSLLPWAQAQAQADPRALATEIGPILNRLGAQGQDRDDRSELRSQLLYALAQAYANMGDTQAAQATLVRRYLTEPTAPSTPPEPPVGSHIGAAAAMGRIELQVAAHRNREALTALEHFDGAYPGEKLTLATACQRHYLGGIAARKLHRYSEAEAAMGWCMGHCDGELRRRAAFVQAKVISIQDGLRALAPIEAFAAAYPSSTMVDDVLFWAGDILQRRGRNDEAAAYYNRIVHMPVPDDQCVEAGWRLAWMAYRAGKLTLAKERLQQALVGRCALGANEGARALYWLGRIHGQSRARSAAKLAYSQAIERSPMSFYAQLATTQLAALVTPAERATMLRAARPPAPLANEALCVGRYGREPTLRQALALKAQGLHSDAAAALSDLPALPPLPRRVKGRPSTALQGCGAGQSALLQAQLLSSVGAHRRAHVLLLQNFSSVLAGPARPGDGSVWRALYPLAYRDVIAASERASQVPELLLQALAREESGFDVEVVSWAEAYGLTQLLLGAAQTAGRKLTPPRAIVAAKALFDPELNTALGGALLGSLGRRYQGFWPLALAGYNGGQGTADAWWQKFAGAEFGVFAEEMTVAETRGYVQRVWQTFGIYRWLYANAGAADAWPERLPVKSGAVRPQVPPTAAPKKPSLGRLRR